jgi:hypothetical protein
MSMTPAVRVAIRFNVRTAAARYLYAFGVNDLSKLMGMGRSFGVVSAYRSGLPKSQNQERHGQLIADLQKMGHRNTHPLKSSWEDMATKVTHKEKSVFVPNIDFSSLVELGSKYEQDAILFKDASGTIGVYFKDHTAVMAYDNSAAMGVDKSTDPSQGYSKGRGLSFGLQLVEDRKFRFTNNPITKKQLEKELSL